MDLPQTLRHSFYNFETHLLCIYQKNVTGTLGVVINSVRRLKKKIIIKKKLIRQNNFFYR